MYKLFQEVLQMGDIWYVLVKRTNDQFYIIYQGYEYNESLIAYIKDKQIDLPEIIDIELDDFYNVDKDDINFLKDKFYDYLQKSYDWTDPSN